MNVGLIGAGFMAKAHSIAYAGMPMFFWPAPIIPVKKMIVDMNEAIAREAKISLLFESYSTDWHDVVNNPRLMLWISALRIMFMLKLQLQLQRQENILSGENHWH